MSLKIKEKKRIPLERADAIALVLAEQLRPMAEELMIAGSVRRRRSEIGDIEFVVLPKDLECFLFYIEQLGFTQGGERKRWRTASGIKQELYIAHKPEEMGAMLLTYTGDAEFNIALRSIAKRRGMLLNQYGLWKGKTPVVQSPREEPFFKALDVEWHDPEDRSLRHRGKRSLGARMGDARPQEPLRRRAGYIDLELRPPDEETESFVLKVVRNDPYGGAPWEAEYDFEDEETAARWYESIMGDEDLDLLHRGADREAP